jgi:hypothetical protein
MSSSIYYLYDLISEFISDILETAPKYFPSLAEGNQIPFVHLHLYPPLIEGGGGLVRFNALLEFLMGFAGPTSFLKGYRIYFINPTSVRISLMNFTLSGNSSFINISPSI